jgi:hypothetical protein
VTMALEPLASEAGQDLAQKEVEGKVRKTAKNGVSRKTGAGTGNFSSRSQGANRVIQGSVARPRSRSRSVSLGKSHVKTHSGPRSKSTDLKLKPPAGLTGGGGKVSTLMIEWILGLLLIFWAMFSGNKQQIGKGQAHNFFWQFFAWNFIFFVLALLMRGKNTGKAAVMIGALLVLSLVLLNATNITAFSKLFANAKSLNTSPTSGSGGTGTTQQGAAAPTTNPVVNAEIGRASCRERVFVHV